MPLAAAGGSVPGRAVLAARLIAAGQQALRRPAPSVAPGFEINLPTGWRSDPAVASAFAWRHDAAARAGLTDELERIRFEWTPDAGLPRSSGRLVFRPEPDDDAFLDMFRQIAVGSLDVITRREVAALGAARQARDDMGIYLAMAGDRDWWRLAYTADGGRPGQLAGMILPNRNSSGAVVGYLGVVPGMRGRGYINDLVAETTRFHAGRGEPRIAATTDTTNLPMATAFERAGYRAWGIRYVLLISQVHRSAACRVADLRGGPAEDLLEQPEGVLQVEPAQERLPAAGPRQQAGRRCATTTATPASGHGRRAGDRPAAGSGCPR